MKVIGGVGWWGGGPCDFSVSPSPFGLDFGTLDFGTSDSGLTIIIIITIPLGNPLNLREVVRPKLDPSTKVSFDMNVGLLLMFLPDFVVEATGY